MEGHDIPWWEPHFEGMCYMHGICLDMLTPMLYIFVWPKRWGVTRDKGFAHIRIVEFKALDQVYRVCIAHGMFGKEIHECTPIFMGHVDMSGEGISMRLIGDPSGGIVREWFQSFVY